MLEELKRFLLALIADDELHELVAKEKKKSFDALVHAGFTKDQAALIVAHQHTNINQN